MQIRKSGVDGKISIDSVNYIPVYCYDKGGARQDRYELIDIKTAMAEYESGNKDNVSDNLYNTIKKELVNIESVLGKPIIKENKEQSNS